MTIFWQIVYLLLWLFQLLVIGRVVIELVRVFARSWRPSGAAAVTCEVVYTATDPPVKLLRRLIPSVRVGGVGFDLSIIVLFVAIWIALAIAGNYALTGTTRTP